MGWSGRLLLVEAATLLLLMKILLAVVPFRCLARRLGSASVSPHRTVPTADVATAQCVSVAVRRAVANLPFRLVCLPQAMAATFMLARRNVPSTLYLGVDKDPAGRLIAHAWVVVGEHVVTGAGKEEFTPITALSQA
ncbi:MAG: lasso peptide biosynthesis B2 protein [Candidatus Schekmanbacteria bacterium]|nr:lasso peptide biosynthesis B2 protein [Candidatus Schekmanbacteria bacterium]